MIETDNGPALPRGIRNHNPLNIEAGANWVGLDPRRTDERFAVFTDPAYGIRAAARVLQTYAERHAINTIAGVIARWAPDAENPTGAYVTAVSIWADRDPEEPLDLTRFDDVRAILRAMVRFENGKPPPGRAPAWYDEATWERGLRLAGLVPDKPLRKSRTVKGAALAAGSSAIAAGVLADALSLPASVEALIPVALASVSEETAALIALAVSVAGAAWAAWARYDDKQRGRV